MKSTQSLVIAGAFALGGVFGFAVGQRVAHQEQLTQPIIAPRPALSVAKEPIPGAEASALASKPVATPRTVDPLNRSERFAPEKGVEAPSTFAAGLLEDMTKALREESSQAYMKQLARVSELKPRDASFFIQKINDPTEGERRQIDFKLLIACGGEEVAEALKAELGREGRNIAEQNAIAGALLGEGVMGYRVNPIPVDADLRSLAIARLSSADPRERVIAIGILSHDTTDEARAQLHALLEKEKASNIGMKTLVGLGYIGNEATLVLLERLSGGIPNTDQDFPPTKESVWRSELGTSYETIRKRLGK